MQEKRKINFLLYGEGSFLNKGCEAIVNTTIKKIRKKCDGEIILSTNDMNDQKSYNNIITKYVKGYYKEDELTEDEKKKLAYYKTIPFDYTNFEKIYEKDCIKEIENADICIHVGGDNYCYGEPNWIYTINKEVKEKSKKNVFWCTSLFEKIESDEMIRDLKSYDLIMARETLTYNALSKYVEKERLVLVPDTAFSLETTKIELPNIFKENKKVLGINISPLISQYTEDANHILDSFKALIDSILKDTDYNICLIPHVYIKGNNDLDSLKMIKDLYKDEDRIYVLEDRIYNCQELKYVISNCDYLIAARTHASIAGYSSIVPTLVIGYSVKSKGIAKDLFGDYENYVIPVDKITPELLLEKFKYIMNNEDKIKEILKNKMPLYKEETENLVNIMLKKLDALDKKYITSKNGCTGCMACVNICPNHAIKLVERYDGFKYPEIDDEKCTRCNLCKRICPVNKVYKNKLENVSFYATKSKNEDDREKSSSGGMVALLSKEILKNNGVVYGVALEDKIAKHIRIDNEKDLYKIMGSKYVQSEVGDIYKKVKDDLKNDIKVMFTGTPCQIEGLKSFLGKEYDNLICISIICHGVPSPEVFKRYLNEIQNYDEKKITHINFRNKEKGWHNYLIEYIYEDGNRKIIPFTQDTYMKGFLRNYFLRESCYNCEMRFSRKNSADIIIGDYWGVENVFPEFDDDKGISALIINSEKGRRIFEKIKDRVNYKETTFESILRVNLCLTSSVKYTKKRDQFFEMIKRNEIYTTINTLNMENLNKEIEDKNEEIKYLKGQINLRDISIEEKNKELQRVQTESKNNYDELQRIYNSKRWKYTNKIGNMINKIKGKNC